VKSVVFHFTDFWLFSKKVKVKATNCLEFLDVYFFTYDFADGHFFSAVADDSLGFAFHGGPSVSIQSRVVRTNNQPATRVVR